MDENRETGFSCAMLCALLFLMTGAYAERAGWFEYRGVPEKLNGKTVNLPDSTVAMSRNVFVGDVSSMFQNAGPTSIFFIVDNSVTMMNTDGTVARFIVVNALLDSIMARSPQSEVGLAVFSGILRFDPPDDALFKTVYLYNGGYLQLLGLNKTYGTRTGYSVLKNYLRTSGNDLAYRGLVFSGTHINAGFASAKEAVKTAANPKSKQYIIFFSDGDANTSNPGVDVFYYVKGDSVPTTFTVHFRNDGPGRLQEMTNNIKKNGYSTSNSLSNFWSFKVDQDTLLKLIMEQVISKIIVAVTHYTPKSLNVNGQIPITGWDGKKFSFKDLFPLTGTNTPFRDTIVYKITKDSIVQNDTISIFVKDTTHFVSFTTALPASPITDSVAMTWWGREMGFWVNNAKVTQLTDAIDRFEIRFGEYRIDTTYGYTDVPVTLYSSSGDVEKLSLVKTGAFFSASINRVTASAKPNDGTLQNSENDIITAVFRNAQLPLDTLHISVPFSSTTLLSVATVIYFDNSADGFVDSMFVGINGAYVMENADAIAKALPLPPHRQLTVIRVKGFAGGLGLAIHEGAAIQQTAVSALDKIIIPDTITIAPKVKLLPSTTPIVDSMAPVIMKASLRDSVKQGARDELTVDFSEPIISGTEIRPFLFYSMPEKKVFSAQLAWLSVTGSTGLYIVKTIEGALGIKDGDSIWIKPDVPLPVGDNAGNRQDNPANIRRPVAVTVIEEGIRVVNAAFFDRTADGHVDSVYVQTTGVAVVKNAQTIVDALVFPPWRKLVKTGYFASDAGIGITVDEGMDSVNTAATPDDILRIADTVSLPDGQLLYPAAVPIEDRMAPVLMRARYTDSIVIYKKGNQSDTLFNEGIDSLVAIFSEPVKTISPARPYLLMAKTVPQYTARLSMLFQNQANAVARVWAIEGAPQIAEGDSIWISWDIGLNVVDLKDNNQTNRNNIKRSLQKTIYLSIRYDLALQATLLRDNEDVVLSQSLMNLPGIGASLEHATKISDRTYRGIMILTVSPVVKMEQLAGITDTLAGTISLYDPLGNIVLDRAPFSYERQLKRLVYVWTGRNESGRAVGSGAYLAVAIVDRYDRDKNIYRGREVFKAFVGVQRE